MNTSMSFLAFAEGGGSDLESLARYRPLTPAEEFLQGTFASMLAVHQAEWFLTGNFEEAEDSARAIFGRRRAEFYERFLLPPDANPSELS